MKTFLSTACLLAVAFIGLVSALTVPNADTPVFYLVSSSTSSSNLLPLRMNSAGFGFMSLLGGGSPALFYFYQGLLTVYDPNGNTSPYRPLINTVQNANGCGNFGAIALVQGTSTNKCASYTSFQIQSNGLDSQLGAELVFNYVGGFYACSSGQEVWYKVNPNDGPSGCQPIHLNTVPAA